MQERRRPRLPLCLTLLLMTAPVVCGQDPPPPAAAPLPIDDLVSDRPEEVPWLLQNLRFSIDLSTRVTHSTLLDETSFQQAVGFDLHKVFSGSEGDWGTMLLQGYLLRIDDQTRFPPFFDDEDDWVFQHRIFNFNYTGLSDGLLNFKVGHFEIPFGLEVPINTNGTLRQYLLPQNLGLKADWGMTINGELPAFEYEFGVSRGSGVEWSNSGDPWAVSGRVGTPRSENTVVGVSFFHGEVQTLRGPLDTVRRTRIGVDAQWYHGLWGVLAEVSTGGDEGNAVINGLVELDWRDPDERWLLYAQIRGLFKKLPTGPWDDAVSAVAGVRFTPDEHWAFSVQLIQDMTAFGNGKRDTVIAMQTRFRF